MKESRGYRTLQSTIILGLRVMFIVGILITGWLSNDIYNDWNYQREYDGLRIGNVNRTTAFELANSRDGYGDWVCVNIKGMEYKRAVEVCQHEVGHEIFAEICEKDIDKCMEVVE